MKSKASNKIFHLIVKCVAGKCNNGKCGSPSFLSLLCALAMFFSYFSKFRFIRKKWAAGLAEMNSWNKTTLSHTYLSTMLQEEWQVLRKKPIHSICGFRYRPPFSRGGRGRPLLSRGRSMDVPSSSAGSYLGGVTGGGGGGYRRAQPPTAPHSQSSTPLSAHRYI